MTSKRSRIDSARAAATPSDETAIAVTRKSVVTSVLWNSFSTLASIPILLVTTILVARILGVSEFGKYALYTLLIPLLVSLADLGIGATIVRRGALAAGNADGSGTLGAVRAGVTWSIVQLPWNVAVGFIVLHTWTAGAVYALAALWNVLFIGCAHYLVMTNQLRVPSLLNLICLPRFFGCDYRYCNHNASS